MGMNYARITSVGGQLTVGNIFLHTDGLLDQPTDKPVVEITKCSDSERMLRALRAIEQVALDSDHTDMPKDVRELLALIHKIAHAGRGTCCFGGANEDWRRLIEEVEAAHK